MESRSLQQARERILKALTRAGAVLGLLALLFTLPSFIAEGVLHIFPVYLVAVCALWVMALGQNLPYRLRAATLLFSTYLLGLTELLNFGYTVDGHAYLIACALLGVLFFNQRIGTAILLANILTLLGIGGMIATGRFVVWEFLFRDINWVMIIDTAVIFFSVVGALQFGVAVLLTQLDTALQDERQLRDQLEARVEERTRDLALARDAALATGREVTEQRAYMTALYETTLDLLNRRQMDDLLQSIVERATLILNAPYGELMIRDGDALVVRAHTANQPFLKGDRVGRHEARISWQACDSGQPVVLDDYAAWVGRRDLYMKVAISAVADFPIMIGDHCQGVLALGRAAKGHVFTAQDIRQGQLFSQLIALVLENARLYDTAQREIAERAEVELALQRSAQELQAQNSDLDAFGHTVAHDLKTPLTAIIGYSQLLQLLHRKMDADAIERDLQSILMAGRKMTTIINELLLLANVRRSGPISYERLDMATIIAEVTARLAHLITESQATLSGPPAWPAALGYAPWVEEVWVNYVSNALKYGGTPPQIRIGADPPAGGFVRFWVRDNGAGISGAQQELLFNAFTRLQPARADGHGLGLSIVSRIVEKLGGSVGVESRLGEGSTFSFTLPVA
ncbi:GAF domain-containing sensor histidine kinase [Oscillochloris sp. ZM17-4]|uniref:sensor histidine kinase n=1 Tax=Oscillochloris sp. ZM17-4 TaxID=2866714 RepID=UPI001C73BEED|nr:GAF domain-containing sensor histidine kinase [Oscillochloris sp. ZM17-4]MBX0328323.1 GAF domain-containing sensor histidine kinase [Oscillochloris sp. ZM17-4]